MNADMSPEAVTSRLRTMDELWQLSQKLMNSKRVKRSLLSDNEQEREVFQESVNAADLENE